MKDKTKEQLTAEIELLRQEMAELEQEKAEGKRAGRLLQALNQASENMERTLTPEEIFRSVAGQLKKLGFSSIVFLTDESQKRLFLKYWSYETAAIRTAEKLAGRKHEDFPILIEAVDVYRKTVWGRETVFIGNVKDVIEQLFQAVLPGPAKKLTGPIAKVLKVSKAIDAPLIVGNKVVGMLSVQSGDLTADDIPAITAFAHQMAAAWHKATLLQDLKRSLAERKRAEEALQKAHDDLERRVEERTAELLKSNEQLTQEISERKWAEEKLRASEQNFRSSLDNSPLGIRIVSAEGETLYVNQVILDIYGYSSLEELEAVPRSKRYAPESYVEHQERKEKRKLGKFVPPHYEISIVRKDGEVRQMQVFRREVMWGGKTQFQVIYHDITEQKKAGEELQRSEGKYRALFESKLDGVFVLDAETMRVVLANQAAVEMYGFNSVEEVIGVNPLDSVVPEERERALKIMVQDMFENNLHQVNEFRTITKDGKEKWISAVGTRIEYEGKLAGLISFRDITECKQAEELYMTLANSSQVGVYIVQDGKFQFVNPKFEEYTGFSQDELLGTDPLRLVHSEDRKMVRKSAVKMLRGKRSSPYEFRIITKGGEIRWILETVTSIHYRGERAALGNYMDITEQKEARNRLEELEALESSILDAVPHAVIGLHERRIVFANKGVEAVFGWRPEELIGKTTRVLYRSEEEYEEIARRVYPVLERQQTYSLEFPCRRKDGRDIICLVSDSRIGESLKERRIVVTYEDITERKKAEEELRSSEERLKIVFEFAPDAYYLNDLKGDFIDGNRAAGEITGYKREELIGKSFLKLKLLSAKQTPKAAMLLAKNALGQPTGPDEFTLNRKDGSQVSVEIRTFPVRIKEQTLVLGIARDITERKRAEEELRRSEGKYRTTFENTGTAMAIVEEDTIISLVNSQFEKLAKYSKEEIEGKKRWTEFVHQEDLERMKEYHRERRESGGKAPTEYEFRFVDREGNIKNIFLTVEVILGTKKSITSLIDITERKRAEEEIKYQRKYFQSLFESSPEAVASLDPQNLIVDINPTFEKMFGYTLEDIKGRDIDDFILPTSKKEEGRSFIRRAWEGEVAIAWSIRKRADGTKIPVSILGAPIILDGKQIGMFAIYRDITERKKAREQLERSFVDLAETISRAMESRDPYTSGHQRRVAELACLVGEKMGLDKNRLQGLHIGGLLHDIGKISTPESILSKPGRLTREEQALVYTHAKQGYKILKGTNLPWPVADMALHHHERLDGSGYPHGISGDKLSLENRILGVCDVVEAMSSHRPYRPARSKEEVLEEIKNGRGTKYDANVVDVMLEIIESGEFDFSSS